MTPDQVANPTHRFAKPENWDDTANGPCGDLLVRAQVGRGDVVELVSAWKPSADELAQLNAGALVEILICAANQPAMAVGVVQPTVMTAMSHDEHGPAQP